MGDVGMLFLMMLKSQKRRKCHRLQNFAWLSEVGSQAVLLFTE